MIRASVDGFHQPKALRHRRGRSNPEGFFHDSYGYAALSACLLDPLSPGGGGTYRRAVFDHTADRMVEAEAEQAPPGAVLVLDGIFLYRDELVRYWDYSVFLTAGFAATFARPAARDGGDPDPGADSNRRYLEGQRLYLAACRPQERARIVIDDTDLCAPRVVGRDPADRRPARRGWSAAIRRIGARRDPAARAPMRPQCATARARRTRTFGGLSKVGTMTERDWDELGEGVFRKRFEPCDVTVTAVVGSGGVAVVDTRCSLAEAREIKEQVRRLTSAPVRWVVNTHAHFDHCWGNAEFVEPRLTPPARIWAHASVPARMDPQDPRVRELVAQLAAQGPPWAGRMAQLELAAPTGLVADRASIDLGDRSLRLRYLGRGHTDGDLWIFIGGPDDSAPPAQPAAIVLAGDLVEQSGPPAFGPDSFPLEWTGTLDRALALIAPDSVIVPGHGAVVDAAFVRDQRDAIDAVAQEIRRLHAAGVPVRAAAAAGSWAIEAKALGSAVERGYAALA